MRFFPGRKTVKNITIGVVIGLLVGLWAGYNLGKGKPVFSNPFVKDTLRTRIKKTGGKVIEKGGEVLEESGKALRNAVSGD